MNMKNKLTCMHRWILYNGVNTCTHCKQKFDDLVDFQIVLEPLETSTIDSNHQPSIYDVNLF